MPAFFPYPTNNFQNAWRVRRPPRAVMKKKRTGAAFQQSWTRGFQIRLHGRQGRLADGRNPLLVPLPDGAQDAAFEIEIGDPDGAQFRDAEAGGVEQLQHGVVPNAGRLGCAGSRQQQLDLVSIQKLRDILPLLGSDQTPLWVRFDLAFRSQNL